MASVDSISPVYISTDKKTFTVIGPKDVRLMGAGMRSQNGLFVDIVRVGLAASRMIGWEA